jgi:sulfonate transport system substrate-binding protein
MSVTLCLLPRRGLIGLLGGAVAAPYIARAAVPIVIRIGVASIGVGGRQFFGGSPGATMRAGGYLEEEFRADGNVRVEWSFFRGAGPAVNEAIANDQLDLAYQGDLPSIIARANGLKTRLLAASGAHIPIYLATPPGSDIRGVKDLKGRRVALYRGTNGQLAADKVLAANGLTERDLKVFNMDTATSLAAIADRQVDAAFGDLSLLSLSAQGLARIAYSSKHDNPAFGRRSHILATESFLADHPDLTARIMKAYARAAWWSSEERNRDALFALWAKSGIPATIYRADFAGQTLAYRDSPLLDDFALAQYRTQAKMALRYGLVRRDVDVRGWPALDFLNAALKELELEHYWTRYDADGKATSI